MTTAGQEGLCARCGHRREVTSARGTRYVLCALSRTDDRFPRYPRLPVRSCSGFDPRSASDGGVEGPNGAA